MCLLSKFRNLIGEKKGQSANSKEKGHTPFLPMYVGGRTVKNVELSDTHSHLENSALFE